MRAAGLPVESMIEYVSLFLQGDETIPARLDLLNEQLEQLHTQKKTDRRNDGPSALQNRTV